MKFSKWIVAVLLVSATAHAQVVITDPGEANRQRDLELAHSVLQKMTLGSLGVTGVLGLATAYNKDTAFGRGRCGTENGAPLFGRWGCEGLPILHGIAGVLSTGLFIATESVAASMPVSPYDDPDRTKQDAMRTLRWVNVGLVAGQGVMGLIAAFPAVIGIPPAARADFSRIMRTVHIGTGITLAGTFTATAVLQW